MPNISCVEMANKNKNNKNYRSSQSDHEELYRFSFVQENP